LLKFPPLKYKNSTIHVSKTVSDIFYFNILTGELLKMNQITNELIDIDKLILFEKSKIKIISVSINGETE
jgi:hypothetical protein